MADDGRVKRLKTSEDGAANAELQRRNAELHSENEELRRENAQFRARLEGEHTVLPVARVVTITTTVDLSRVDTSIVTQISSFLGASLELFNLALTCKSFGWRQPTSTQNWSLVEEVSRQLVCSRATDDEMGCLPRYVGGTRTWLSILNRFEHLLLFDVLLGGHIEHRNGDKATVHSTHSWVCTAVSSGSVMRTGTHYAEFQITGGPSIGIVRPMPSLETGAFGNYCFFIGLPRSGITEFYPTFLAQRSDDWGDGSIHACEYLSGDGTMKWTNWGSTTVEGKLWEGMKFSLSGDTVGMLLNLDNGTLTVYKNNRRLGVLKDGLSGPYCWYATLYTRDAVSIRKGLPPALNHHQMNGSH